MNEQIKALMIKHGLHQYISEDCQHRMEMLAELLIQECINCCGAQADKKNIRQRFGLPIESNIKYPSVEPQGHHTQYGRRYDKPSV
jgi:hypothetical protein